MSSTPSLSQQEQHPVTLLPRLVERIWGAESFAPYFAAAGRKIGEIWLTAAECAVEGSALTLGELTAREPAIFGARPGSGFPLLIKLLFPSEKLSVQVHPDDAYAQAALGQPRGKTECWYVLSAEPGAQVAVGFREPLDPEKLRSAIRDGSLESHLRMLPVTAGDMIFIDAGTVHAIGPGMVLLEVQQYSDVTYRLWDYGRPRELHVEEGLAVMRPDTGAGPVRPVAMGAFTRLLSCPYFTVDRFRLEAGTAADLAAAESLQILVAVDAGATLRSPGAQEHPLLPTNAAVLPIGVGACSLHATGAADVIRIMPGSAV